MGLSSNSNKTNDLLKSKHICLVTTSKCLYLQENHVIIILILTCYFLLLLIMKVHYSQFLYVIVWKLSICSYYLCLIDILHGKKFNSKVISNTHFIVSPNITQYIKMLFHILKYMLFFRVFRTIKIKYLILFICVLHTLSYELSFLILVYCVLYIYTCTIEDSAKILFLLGLYNIKATCTCTASDYNYKHVYMVSVQRSMTSLYCWPTWAHTVINKIIKFILYPLLYDILVLCSYHVIFLVSFLCRLYPRNELFQISLTLIVVYNYEYRCIYEGECSIPLRCAGRGCICNYYVHVFLMFVLATIIMCIQFPFFFRKGIELIISAIISLQSLIFKWTTFEISLSLTRFNVLLLCVDYANSTCIDNSLYKHTHNFLSMVNTGYISDVIQVQSHSVWKGILMGGGGET